jgi:hypothetical protein
MPDNAHSSQRHSMASTTEKIFEIAQQFPDALALEALHYLEYLRLRAEEHGQDLTGFENLSGLPPTGRDA